MAVTALPDWLNSADQPCCTRWLEFGKVQPSVQPLTGSPRFLMVTLAVKPPGQSLVVYATLALRCGLRRGDRDRHQPAGDQDARAGEREGPAWAGQPSPHIHATDLLGRDRARIRPGEMARGVLHGRPPAPRDSSGVLPDPEGRAVVVVNTGARPVDRRLDVVRRTGCPRRSACAVWLPEPRAPILAWERFHGNGSMRGRRSDSDDTPELAARTCRVGDAAARRESRVALLRRLPPAKVKTRIFHFIGHEKV